MSKSQARLGVPIFIQTMKAVVAYPTGLRTVFYWFASEQNKDWTLDEVLATQELHGPFDTEAAARAAAHTAILGNDCKVIEGGVWDPAWEKPQ